MRSKNFKERMIFKVVVPTCMIVSRSTLSSSLAREDPCLREHNFYMAFAAFGALSHPSAALPYKTSRVKLTSLSQKRKFIFDNF